MKIKDGYIKVKSYDGYVVTPTGEETEKKENYDYAESNGGGNLGFIKAGKIRR